MMRRWVMLGVAILVSGCGRDDIDRLGRVGTKAAAKFEAMTGGARGKLVNGWTALRGSLGETTPDSRVALRLRWDRGLAGIEFEVSSPTAGEVRLRGVVADEDQHRKAIGLAQETEGVEKVVDELKVSPR
jgi:osmotically-inducible protein OsmY